MDLETVRNTAKEKLKGYCRVCPVCDGCVCAGEVPRHGEGLEPAVLLRLT